MSGVAWVFVALAIVAVLVIANYRALLRALRIRRGDDDR